MLVLVIQSIIIIIVAVLLGLTIATGVGGLILIFVTILFFDLAWAGLLLAVGLRTKKAETVSAVGNLMAFPLIFISSAIFPVAIMPQWAQTVSSYNPVTYASNVVRDLLQGGLTLGTFATAYAVIGLIAIVTFAVRCTSSGRSLVRRVGKIRSPIAGSVTDPVPLSNSNKPLSSFLDTINMSGPLGEDTSYRSVSDRAIVLLCCY